MMKSYTTNELENESFDDDLDKLIHRMREKKTNEHEALEPGMRSFSQDKSPAQPAQPTQKLLPHDFAEQLADVPVASHSAESEKKALTRDLLEMASGMSGASLKDLPVHEATSGFRGQVLERGNEKEASDNTDEQPLDAQSEKEETLFDNMSMDDCLALLKESSTVSTGADDARGALNAELLKMVEMINETSLAGTPEHEVSTGFLMQVANAVKEETGNGPTMKSRMHSLSVIKKAVAVYQAAGQLYRAHQFRYLVDPESGLDFCTFDGRVWRPISSTLLSVYLMEELEEEQKVAISNWDAFCKNVKSFLSAMAAKDYNEGLRFSEDDHEKVRNRVVFNNLVYDTQTGETLPFDSTLPYVRAIDANYIEGDPDHFATPAYDKLRGDATGWDVETMNMFDHMLAYLAVPNRSGKCFFALGTEKDSGKSIFLEFCTSLFGTWAFAVEPEKLGGRFALEKAPTAALLFCKDLSTGPLGPKAVSQIKVITGDKEVRSEGKFKAEVTVPVRFKMVVATNEKIVHTGRKADAAFYRRLILLPFLYSAEDIESDLGQRLAAERDLVLTRAVQKLRGIMDDAGGVFFPESALSKSTKKAWYMVPDYVEEFVNVHLRCPNDANYFISSKELYKKYADFCSESIRNSGKGSVCRYDNFNEELKALLPDISSARRRPSNGVNPVIGFENLCWKP